MDETIEDMSKQIEPKDSKTNCLAVRIGISDEQLIEEMEQANLTESLD